VAETVTEAEAEAETETTAVQTKTATASEASVTKTKLMRWTVPSGTIPAAIIATETHVGEDAEMVPVEAVLVVLVVGEGPPSNRSIEHFKQEFVNVSPWVRCLRL